MKDHTASSWRADAPGLGVLALHGFTGSGADWAPIAHALERPVLAPDLLGHGDSPAPAHAEAYAIDRVVRHAHAWCASRERWIVIGYSMGGRVAMRLAPLLRDRLAGLVLISTSPGIEDPTERAERAERDRALADAIQANGTAWFAERWAHHPIIRSQLRLPGAILGPMRERRQRNRPAGLAGSLRGMGQGAVEPVWHALPELPVRTLWITGDVDLTYTAIAERGVGLMPNARHLRMPGVGHCTHLEALDGVVEALRGFVG